MLKPDITTGRLMILTDETIVTLTPREFFKYIDEGFVPCYASYNEDIETGLVSYMYDFVSVYTMASPYNLDIGTGSFSSQDLDTPYTKEQP